MERERAEAYVAAMVAQAREDAAHPERRECHCTGACGGDAKKCPHLAGPVEAFEQRIERLARWNERDGRSEMAALFRAALAPTASPSGTP